jgi:hypothetical protein
MPAAGRAKVLGSTAATAFSGGNEDQMGVKKTGKGRRKIGRKKRKMRSRIRHRK